MVPFLHKPLFPGSALAQHSASIGARGGEAPVPLAWFMARPASNSAAAHIRCHIAGASGRADDCAAGFALVPRSLNQNVPTPLTQS